MRQNRIFSVLLIGTALILFTSSAYAEPGVQLQRDPYSRLRPANEQSELGWHPSISVGLPNLVPFEMKYGRFEEDPWSGRVDPEWYLGAGVMPYPTGIVLSAYRATASRQFYLRGGYTLMLLPKWGNAIFWFAEFDDTSDRLIQFASITAGINIPDKFIQSGSGGFRVGAGYFVMRVGNIGTISGWYIEISSLLWSH